MYIKMRYYVVCELYREVRELRGGKKAQVRSSLKPPNEVIHSACEPHHPKRCKYERIH